MPDIRDFLICYSTIFGHFAFLHYSVGSLFVRKLCSTLLDVKCIEEHDICGILIIVARKVSSAKITLLSDVYCTQMPSFQVNLRKIFNFSLVAKHMYANITTPRLSFGRTNMASEDEFCLFWPNSVYIDEEENVYIADGSHNRILIFSKCGIYLRMVSEGLSRPHGICILDDNIVSTQWESHSVTFHSQRTGKLLYQFGTFGRSHGNFDRPTGVDICCSRNVLYICDLNNNRVQMFQNFSSKFLASISQLFQPQDVRIHDNTVNILDKGDPCMHIFNLDHVLLRRIVSRGEIPKT